NHITNTQAVLNISGHSSTIYTADGDAEGFTSATLRAGDGVAAPVAHAIHVDAEAHVLAGHSTVEQAVGTDHQGHRTVRFAANLLDTATAGCGPQRVDQFQVLLRLQRAGEPATDLGSSGVEQRTGHRRSPSLFTCVYFNSGT